ncbi:MAG: 3-dehydroquinate synthase [Oscillospiraceae bacterium]|nr:3-dehydroquinate synthase [Oscillospiraceae bacterium]
MKRIIPVKTHDGAYNIYLYRGALSDVGRLLNLNRRVMVVTDSGVPKEYSEAVLKAASEGYIVEFPQGEKSKTMKTFEQILSALTENSFSRADAVVAVGGGVVGDIAGFAAASYMRGIDFYNIPTTLLSQVDSSIGGKTAVDFGGYKNIIGAFKAPNAVVIDPDTLKTLDPRQISNGMAEALKMGLTSDKKLFDIFENKNPFQQIEEVIFRSLSVKKRVVEKDEKEKGLRKILNFGHTVGHAVEMANPELFHGECVALGMTVFISDDLKDRLISALKKLSLPTEISESPEALRQAIEHDKKKSGKKISIVTVPKIGKWAMKEMTAKEIISKIKEAAK